MKLTPAQLRSQARFDQSNALYREAMTMIRETDEMMFALDEEDRYTAVAALKPASCLLMVALAESAGLTRLRNLLTGKGNTDETDS